MKQVFLLAAFVLAFTVNCSAQSANITFTLTAPGDDGAVGTAAEYDIRYSTDSLALVNNWDGTEVLRAEGEPAPQVAGTFESFTLSFSDIASETTYFFAIKARDEAFNLSGLSNVVRKTSPDILAPNAIITFDVAF